MNRLTWVPVKSFKEERPVTYMPARIFELLIAKDAAFSKKLHLSFQINPDDFSELKFCSLLTSRTHDIQTMRYRIPVVGSCHGLFSMSPNEM